MNTFVEDWKNGIAQADQIDDYIDRWHTGNSGLPLATYLGLSSEQYVQWLKDPEQLQQIL
ncbi:MAG: hypothetical protein JWP57_4280 [Spirosoma sp.]|nr:hypothetical protein [Spirosoma sp.]